MKPVSREDSGLMSEGCLQKTITEEAAASRRSAACSLDQMRWMWR